MAATRTRVGTARFDSVDELVRTEVEGTPLGDRITGEAYRELLAEAQVALRHFTTAAGKAEVPIQGHLITARK